MSCIWFLSLEFLSPALPFTLFLSLPHCLLCAPFSINVYQLRKRNNARTFSIFLIFCSYSLKFFGVFFFLLDKHQSQHVTFSLDISKCINMKGRLRQMLSMPAKHNFSTHTRTNARIHRESRLQIALNLPWNQNEYRKHWNRWAPNMNVKYRMAIENAKATAKRHWKRSFIVIFYDHVYKMQNFFQFVYFFYRFYDIDYAHKHKNFFEIFAKICRPLIFFVFLLFLHATILSERFFFCSVYFTISIIDE